MLYGFLAAEAVATKSAALEGFEWRHTPGLAVAAVALNSRVEAVEAALTDCKAIRVLHSGSDQRKEDVFGGDTGSS